MSYENYVNEIDNFEETFGFDKPSELAVTVAIASAIDDLPDHYIRSRHIKFNRGSKQRLARKLEKGIEIAPGDIEASFTKNDSSGTLTTKVDLIGGWKERRYNVALVVNVIEYNGTTPVSKTTRTILGWCTNDPHPSFGFPDEAIININSVITRDMPVNGTPYGTVRSTAKLTGQSADEYQTTAKKVLISTNIANKIMFEANYMHGVNNVGGFTTTLMDEAYGSDTKVTKANASASTILTDSINDSLFNRDERPIGHNPNGEVDEFILLLNSYTVNVTGTHSGLKTFTWGAFKSATKWGRFNKLEVFDISNAPIFNPIHAVGSTESIEHDTKDVTINDIGFPLTHGICGIIDKYGLSLLNASFNWIAGSSPVVYTTIVRPLDNSILPPVIINNITVELTRIFDMFTTIVGVQSIEVIFDGGFGKASGISIRVNGSQTAIPLVVSPGLTSLFNESIVTQDDDRITKATTMAIASIMREHGTTSGGYRSNMPLQQPVMEAGQLHIPQHTPQSQQNRSATSRTYGSGREW